MRLVVVMAGSEMAEGERQSVAAGETKRFARTLSIFFSSRFISAASLLAIGILTARILGPEGRGHYALFFTIVGIAVNLGGLGLSQSNIYFLNRERVPVTVLFGNTLFAVAVLSVVAGAIVGLLERYPEIAGMSRGWVFPGWLLWAALVGALLESHVAGLVFGSHFYSFQSRSMIVHAVFLLLATVLVIPAGGDLSAALELRVAASLTFVGWYVQRFASNVMLCGVSVEVRTLRTQLGFGMKNWLQNLIGIVNYRGYILILAAFADPQSLGHFSVALLFVEVIRFIPETVGTLLLPKLVNMLPGVGPGHLTARACRMITFGMVLLGLVLVAVADWLVPTVFGEQFAGSAVVTKMLVPGAVLGTVYQLLTRYFTSEHAQKYSIAAGAVGLVVALLASLILIPEYEAIGAGAAYSASSLATCIVMLWGFGKKSNLSPVGAIVPSRADWMLLNSLAKAKRCKNLHKDETSQP